MLTYFGSACVLFWLWRLTRRWDRGTPIRIPDCLQLQSPLPIRGPLPPLPYIPFGKTLDIPPVIK